MILFFSIFLPDWEGCKKWKKVSKLWKNYPYWGKDEVKTGINSGKIILIGDVGLIGTCFFNIPTWFFFLFFNTFFHDNIFEKMILNHWFKINDLIWFYSRKKCKMIWFDLIWLFSKKNDLIWFNFVFEKNDLWFKIKSLIFWRAWKKVAFIGAPAFHLCH